MNNKIFAKILFPIFSIFFAISFFYSSIYGADSDVSKMADIKSVEEQLNSMTLEEKVAQLFWVSLDQYTGHTGTTATDEAISQKIKKMPIGGFILFDSNLSDTAQTRQLTEGIQKCYGQLDTSIPAFIGVDEEGGRVLRIGDNAKYHVEKVPSMQVLASKGEREVYSSAEMIGRYLTDLGINVDFAPVADVLTDTRNIAIGDRSFGSDPKMVSQYAQAYAKGLHANAVLATYKHFPGHGGTIEDTHDGDAYCKKTITELEMIELVPYKELSNADFVMVSHVTFTEIDDKPASVSNKIITGILREKLDYKGIIISDSMSMAAITNKYTSGDAAVNAIIAGCDMILMPQNFDEAYEAVILAVDKGIITEERIDESVRRILLQKRTIFQ